MLIKYPYGNYYAQYLCVLNECVPDECLTVIKVVRWLPSGSIRNVGRFASGDGVGLLVRHASVVVLFPDDGLFCMQPERKHVRLAHDSPKILSSTLASTQEPCMLSNR